MHIQIKTTAWCRVAVCILFTGCMDEPPPRTETIESAIVTIGTNWAASANGGYAYASDQYDGVYYPALRGNDGVRADTYSWANSYYSRSPQYACWYANGAYPWLRVNFNGTKTIGEIDVFSRQDGGATNTPTPSMTHSQYGMYHFHVQYCPAGVSCGDGQAGAGWVEAATLYFNNLVWNKVVFSPVSASAVRVWIECMDGGNAGTYARLAEIEAWEYPDCETGCTALTPSNTQCQKGTTVTTCGQTCAAGCNASVPCGTSCWDAATNVTKTCGDVIVNGASQCNVELANSLSVPETGSSPYNGLKAGALTASDLQKKIAPLPSELKSEYDMTSGRINRIPASPVFYGRVGTFTGPRTIHVRASCATPNAKTDECDPGLVLLSECNGTFRNVKTDNNVNAGSMSSGIYGGTGSGTTPQSAQVFYDITFSSTTCTVHALVYSAYRGTSKVDINWTSSPLYGLPSFTTWNSFSCPISGDTTCTAGTQRNVIVGGTLVKIGPVSPDSQIQFRTPSRGVNNDEKTWLWVFNPTKGKFFHPNDANCGIDSDPCYNLDSSWTWQTGSQTIPSETFAVVGKQLRDNFVPTSSRPETFGDLKVSPTILGDSTVIPVGWVQIEGTSNRDRHLIDPGTVSLSPGNYLISINAYATEPVGQGSSNPATGAVDECDGDYDGVVTRGRGNDLAFVLEVQMGDQTFTRYVPRAALGTEAPEWNRITANLRIPDFGASKPVKVHVKNIGPQIIVDGRWFYRRNAENTMLRVATLNIEYDSGQVANELKNAVNLLGHGPRYLQNSSEIKYTNNRGAWSWESDILNFNEIIYSDSSTWSRHLAMKNELVWQTTEAWTVVTQGSVTGTIAVDRQGPILMRPWVTNNDGQSAKFGGIFSLPDCAYNGDGWKCFLAYSFGWGDYYTVPARAKVTADNRTIPIGVFHLYLPPEGKHLSERREARIRLINHIKNLLEETPDSFNSTGFNDPKYVGNRFIILGDSNMRNAQCGESNEWLRDLRAHFGYAVDAAMVSLDPHNRTYDMHYGVAPLSPWKDAAGVAKSGFETGLTYQELGIAPPPAPVYGNWPDPFNWINPLTWNNDPSRTYSTMPTRLTSQMQLVPQAPWASGTSSTNGGGGSRLDVVFLVGRGWADDDPVQSYATIANQPATTTSSYPTYQNGFTGASMDIRRYCSEFPDVVDGSKPDRSYAPDHHVTECTAYDNFDSATNSGALVFRSDHKPVGVRLRTLMQR